MFNLALFKTNKLPILLTLLSVVLYSVFAYDLARTDYVKLICIYVVLFFLFYKLVTLNKENTRFLTAIAFIFRAVFILAIPNLSQDFYRFIWDGQMISIGFNPYLTTPDYQMSLGHLSAFPNMVELYQGMKSLNSSHFSNYPPINQLLFVIANLFPGRSILSSVIGLRLIIIAADFGTLYFGKKLLEKLKLPAHNIFWYILNPFIIIELTGNLHFEGVMIFFLVWSLYLLHSGKWKWAAVVFALSITTKLVPLMFLPLFFWWFVAKNKKRTVIVSVTKQSHEKKQIPSSHTPRNNSWNGITKLITFYAIIGVITLLLFAPFYSSQFINNYSKTVGLWFGNFEFNASIYYVAREVAYLFRGWNEIAIISKTLPVLTILFILYLSFFKKNMTTKQLITTMLFSFTFYLFTSTTVHPWYIATILVLSVFTNYKFPLVWSFIVIISYLAYANTNNTENLWIIGFEYLVVYSFFIWEVFLNKKTA